MSLEKSATDVLRETSRTFYLSIVLLPPRIREAVMSSYLSMRAIDEIEDHEQLDKCTKIKLLHEISNEFQTRRSQPARRFGSILKRHRDELPEVTNRLDDWVRLAPASIALAIGNATGHMAQRMAHWVRRDWTIDNRDDLDRYTFCVAGAVGVLLTDLWSWYDGTVSQRRHAIGYGRGLQAVNILRNRSEDLERGVDFFPRGWTNRDFRAYTLNNLSTGDLYVRSFPPGPAREFCHGPQVLAHATLEALDRGESKVCRELVLDLFGEGAFETDHLRHNS